MKEQWEQWTAGEKDQFQRICRKLLRETFLVRDRDEESRKNYFFLTRTLDIFNEYFGYIGFEVRLDRDNGVGMLRTTISLGEGNRMQTGHLNLKKSESLVLCCLWSLYAERVRSGSLKQSILISMAELRMEMEKYGIRDLTDKSSMSSILGLFVRYNLISLSGRVGDEDLQILLYPSLQFAMDKDAFVQFAASVSERMQDKKDEDEDMDEEDSDESDE